MARLRKGAKVKVYKHVQPSIGLQPPRVLNYTGTVREVEGNMVLVDCKGLHRVANLVDCEVFLSGASATVERKAQ